MEGVSYFHAFSPPTHWPLESFETTSSCQSTKVSLPDSRQDDPLPMACNATNVEMQILFPAW